MDVRKFVLMLFTMILAIALVLPWNSGAQSNQPPQKPSEQAPAPPQQPIRVEVSLVNLCATVRDRSKNIIPNLTKEEFRIVEDGVEQKIAAFSHETTLPVTLALLIDTSGSEEAMLGAEPEAASRFLGRVLRKGDLAMVMSFDLDVDLLADFTDNRSTLDRAIHRARINTGGGG